MKRKILILFCFLLWCSPFYSRQKESGTIDIWNGTDVHHNVKLIPYLAEGSDGIAVIVCPGGSYFWHDMKTEGHEVAAWLQENGISAFVLRYRTANVPAFLFPYRYFIRGNRYPDPQDDLRQTIKYLKDHSASLGIDEKKIGAMGFSAGGHLVMSAIELFDKSERPAFVAAIYPVVTMSAECVHKRSRRALLGDNHKNDKALCELLSLEKHVPEDSSPVFLLSCKDDPVVNYRNAELLDSALTAKNVPHKYIQYRKGGHGFGMSDHKGSIESRAWKYEFVNWIKELE